MKRSTRLSLIALVAVVALAATACGSSDDSDAPVPAVDDSAGLPINPDPDGTPPSIGACIEDEPNCADTVVVDEQPGSLGGALVDGGLSVGDALAGDATGVIAVSGFLVVDEQGTRLCELLAESFPAQCGGASITVEAYDAAQSGSLTSSQGVSWTDQSVSLLGEIVDGALVVNALSQ